MKSIAEVSKEFGISTDTLRYYERIGLLPPVQRNSSGYREYDDEDLEWVYFVTSMRNAGISVESLIEYVTLFQEGHNTIPARKQILLNQQKALENKKEEIQKLLDRLNHKIDGYEERLLKYEGKLIKSKKKSD
ncbi:HTH-type transcriptional regulator AdhR [Clostridium puniceum]|uniref:HTH-type transcriptional regulator AdhR n=1 Tax=Clostridium puniceum TaxID=29367 RepID=A0A1S8TGC0_9CLOT|nr:MerR family transcriptional regulator [Clostridium puniceum]OOM76662.1 HTH-type transcriptional regulator AdhR [Clostridium puniceum]